MLWYIMKVISGEETCGSRKIARYCIIRGHNGMLRKDIDKRAVKITDFGEKNYDTSVSSIIMVGTIGKRVGSHVLNAMCNGELWTQDGEDFVLLVSMAE